MPGGIGRRGARLGGGGPADTTVIVFRDERAYRPFQPRYQGKPVENVAGHFIPGPMNYITVRAGRKVDYRSTVYHEYVHLAAQSAVERNSPYYNERDKSSVFYAQSWALMHFLQIGRTTPAPSRARPSRSR